MNYLAHIYLSGEDDELKIGNFIADSVKGKRYLRFSPGIQKGILLHRKIDRFTDTHQTVYQSTHRLFPKYSHYSSVIVDVLYDHFLAKNWADYHTIPLTDFVADFYTLLEQHMERLPKPVQGFFPYMKAQNWLVSYASIEGIEQILFQMNQRINAANIQLHESIKEFKADYALFEAEFTSFFEELETYANQQKKRLNT